MKNYQKGGMPQGMNKSAVMPGQASIKTPPMATPKRGSGTPYSSPSSYGGMNKSAVMPGRASIKTPPMAQEPKRSSSGVVRKSAATPARGSKTPPMATPTRGRAGGARRSPTKRSGRRIR
jgi:hypothetical protein